MSNFPVQPFYDRAPLTVDTSQSRRFSEDHRSALDDAGLDQSAMDSGLEMSPSMADSRRESFAVSSSLFSPKSDEWRPSAVDMQSVPSQGSYVEQQQHLDPFAHNQTATAYGQQGHWSMSTSGSATPLQNLDGLPAEYENNSSLFNRTQVLPGQNPFSNPANNVALFQSMNPSQQIPASQSMMKTDGPMSPLFAGHNELRRGDGIRKKNARFEIPHDRNLNNIDHLIAASTDETEIKELKQQKRLLRNRQAALDSRQRKKMHTERLEDEKKQYTAVINELQTELDETRSRMQHMSHQLQSMDLDKQELIRVHTIETGELRKKVNALMTHVQSLEASAMSSTSVNAGHDLGDFNHHFTEMDTGGVDGSWENMPFLPDFAVDQQDVKQETPAVQARRTETTAASDSDSASSPAGLVFLLFLVGASVLSSRSAPSIPRVSDDVRAASAMLLQDVYKDAGIVPPQASAMESMAPQPSGHASWPITHRQGLPVAGNSHGVAPSMLGELSDSLMHPTQQQTHEQIFSLSAAEYNGVMSQDFLQNAPPPGRTESMNQRRKNLAEALATLRINNNKQSPADVYTRSLLWEQIPSDVVRSFARMMAECSTSNDPDDRSICSNDLDTQ
jgi:hypothetical protein